MRLSIVNKIKEVFARTGRFVKKIFTKPVNYIKDSSSWPANYIKEYISQPLSHIGGYFRKARQISYLYRWYFKSLILKKEGPLQTVLFVTDHCNLNCRNCTGGRNNGSRMKSYEEIKDELIYSYKQGSRFVNFKGGEPTLWSDGDRTLNDLCKLAKQIGFFSCTLTTNGQIPFEDTLADQVWVTVNGYGKYHDAVRGKGRFQELDANIRESGHPHLSIVMNVDKLNKDSVVRLIRYADPVLQIQSVAFNFHTPFPGTEELALSQEEREEVIAKITKMKRKGYQIKNSFLGLKLMLKPDFKKYCWMANYILIDGRRLPQCPCKDLGMCDQCGFFMSGEMYSAMHLNMDTIFYGMRLWM